MDMWQIWLAIAIIAFIIELLGPNLVCIWFSISAIIMAPVSLLGFPIWIQALIFVILSGIFLMVLGRFYKDKLKSPEPLEDNLSKKMIGKTGIVTMAVDKDSNKGQIKIGDVFWKATTDDSQIIVVGAQIKVLGQVENELTLIVSKY